MSKPKSKIVQINNQFIQEEVLKKRYAEEEIRQKNRFLGGTLVLIVLLFILPTFNMVANFVKLQERKTEIHALEEEYKELSAATEQQELLAERLKDETYVEKYARAKYYYSLEGEVIYLLPHLLPK